MHKNVSIEKEPKKKIKSHPSCYPGASGGGSVHPTYGESVTPPPRLTFVKGKRKKHDSAQCPIPSASNSSLGKRSG